MKVPLFSLTKQLTNLCSLIIVTLTLGNEICYANISICLLFISTGLLTHDMNSKTNEKIYS